MEKGRRLILTGVKIFMGTKTILEIKKLGASLKVIRGPPTARDYLKLFMSPWLFMTYAFLSYVITLNKCRPTR